MRKVIRTANENAWLLPQATSRIIATTGSPAPMPSTVLAHALAKMDDLMSAAEAVGKALDHKTIMGWTIEEFCSKTNERTWRNGWSLDYQSERHCSKTYLMFFRPKSLLDYQSERHCSKTGIIEYASNRELDYQSERHCSKTLRADRVRGGGWITSQNDTAPKLECQGLAFGLLALVLGERPPLGLGDHIYLTFLTMWYTRFAMNAAMKTRIVDLHTGTMVAERAGRIGPSLLPWPLEVLAGSS